MAAMYHVEQRGLSTVIHVDHDLDIASSPGLESSIRLAEADQARRIIVSLERCSHCDAHGLTVLLRAKKRHGPIFSIVVPEGARCRRVFEVTGLSKGLSLFPSVECALAGFPPAFLEMDTRLATAV